MISLTRPSPFRLCLQSRCSFDDERNLPSWSSLIQRRGQAEFAVLRDNVAARLQHDADDWWPRHASNARKILPRQRVGFSRGCKSGLSDAHCEPGYIHQTARTGGDLIR